MHDTPLKRVKSKWNFTAIKPVRKLTTDRPIKAIYLKQINIKKEKS